MRFRSRWATEEDFYGEVHGTIAHELTGDGGFGYDPSLSQTRTEPVHGGAFDGAKARHLSPRRSNESAL